MRKMFVFNIDLRILATYNWNYKKCGGMMKKQNIAFAVAASIMCGLGLFVPNFAHAYTVDDNEYAVIEGDTDEERYNDLKQAISDGKNVKLNDDINYYVAISKVPSIGVDHSMTLDLNGHILSTASTSGGTGGNTSIAVTGDGTVFTIKDSSEIGGGAIRYDHKGNSSPEMIRIEAGAKVVMEGGAIYVPYGRYGEGIGVNMKGNGAAFEMTGGAIHSHEDSTHSMSFGVRFNTSGASMKMTGGRIDTYASAIYVASNVAAAIDVSGQAVLTCSTGNVVDIASTKATGKISGMLLDNITLNGDVELKNSIVSGTLTIKGGQRTLSNMALNNVTISGGTNTLNSIDMNGDLTVTGGKSVIGAGTTVVGKTTFQSAVSASLTIEDGATLNGFEQSGKATSVSYTDKDTKVKVYGNYDTYGALVVNGGTFNGDFVIASAEAVEAANAARKEYVESYNEHSGKTAMVYADVAILPVIKDGVFAVEPDEGGIADGYEAEQNEETGAWEILPKEINMVEKGAMESDGDLEGGVLRGSAVFTSAFDADRKAYFELSTLDDDEIEALVLDATAGGDLILPFDASLWSDRSGSPLSIDVHDTSIMIRVILTKEQYDILKSYDSVKVVYFDDDGKEAERFDAVLGVDGDKYYIEFTTTHLSTYGVVGVNEETVAAPESGTMTAAGASASVAALVTAIAVGVLTSITSFAYLVRIRE